MLYNNLRLHLHFVDLDVTSRRSLVTELVSHEDDRIQTGVFVKKL